MIALRFSGKHRRLFMHPTFAALSWSIEFDINKALFLQRLTDKTIVYIDGRFT